MLWRGTSRRGSGNLLVLVSHLATDIGPELFYDDRDGVIANLRSPYTEGVGQCAIGCILNVGHHARCGVVTSRDEGSGMVGVGGDCGGQGTAKNFRVVELRMARIGSGDEDPADRVTSAVREPTFAGLEKSGILMQN